MRQRWKATMPNEDPKPQHAHCVFAVKIGKRNRLEWTGQITNEQIDKISAVLGMKKREGKTDAPTTATSTTAP